MKTLSELSPALQRIAALRDAGHSLRAMADILTSEGVPPIGRAKGWNRSRVQDALQQLEGGENELPPALQRIAELHAQGKSQRAIATILTTEGVPPIGRAKGWNQAGVQKALQQLEAGETGPPRAPSEEQPQAQVDIKIHGPWRKADRLLWEFLLHEVWDDLDATPTHQRPISEAARGLRDPAGRQDRAALCAALDRLARSHVVLSGVWGERRANLTAALLTFSADTETVTFQFPGPALKLVKNPAQYIDLQELLAAKE